jgi:outer membrane lipoprotein-sorting protein
MKRRTLLAASLALPWLVGPAIADVAAQNPADAADISRIQAYLNGLRTLKARFIQIAPDGTTSQGTAWIERPGRMRFQYDPPSPFLLVAGHGLVVFHDSQLQQTSNIPVGTTPLGILLAADITLSGDVTVTNVNRQPGQISLTLDRTKSPNDGTLTLIFATNPLELRQWVVVDAQRRETRVTLYDIQLGGVFNPDLFNYVDPRALDSGGSTNGGG